MKNNQKTVTLSIRVKPDEKERLYYLAKLLGDNFGTEISNAQAFNVAVKEAIEKREKK